MLEQRVTAGESTCWKMQNEGTRAIVQWCMGRIIKLGDRLGFVYCKIRKRGSFPHDTGYTGSFCSATMAV